MGDWVIRRGRGRHSKLWQRRRALEWLVHCRIVSCQIIIKLLNAQLQRPDLQTLPTPLQLRFALQVPALLLMYAANVVLLPGACQHRLGSSDGSIPACVAVRCVGWLWCCGWLG